MPLLNSYQRKAVLLFSNSSLLWQIPDGAPFPSTRISDKRKETICERYATSKKNTDNWTKAETATAKFESFIKKLEDQSPLPLTLNDFEEHVSPGDFARLIGLSHGQARKVLDHYICNRTGYGPLFQHSPEKVTEAGSRASGLYRVYRYDKNDNFEGLTVMALHVRYAVPFEGTRKFIVRAKLNVPNYFSPHEFPYYEYDGALSEKDGYGNYHWMFEQRRSWSQDALFLISDDGHYVDAEDGRSILLMTGTALTRDQSKRPRGVAMPLVLKKDAAILGPVGDLPDIRKLGESAKDIAFSEAQAAAWDKGYEDDEVVRAFMESVPRCLPEAGLTGRDAEIARTLRGA